MPLLVGEDAKGGTGFDVTTAITLFWKPIPVLLRQQDREEQSEDLTFRILTGFARQNHNLRILRVYVSSEIDLHILHTLEVSEEDFQSLKNEQGILVDFASFPGKIISLLEKCTAVPSTESTRFQAVLSVRGYDSVFKIIETNDFKQLPHITLGFRPGNDTAVKQFLAFRLSEVKGDLQEVSEKLAKTTDERESLREELRVCRADLAAQQERLEKHMRESDAAAKMLQAGFLEERAREKAEVKDKFERERADAERRHRDQQDLAAARAEELDQENRRLRQAKFELDTKVSELSHRLASAEGAQRALEEDASRLRAQAQQASVAKHEADVSLSEARAKLSALEEKSQSQQEVSEQQRQRIRELEGGSRQWEARCSDLREMAAAAETRSKESQAELAKAAQMVDKLTTDLRLSKEKVRRKLAIVVRQEEELAQREQALSAATRDAAALARNLEEARSQGVTLKQRNADLLEKLEDSRQQLLNNEQMIRWLNQQLTEAQLQNAGGYSQSSRYSFRPSTLLPSAAGSTALTTTAPGGGNPPAGSGSLASGVASLYLRDGRDSSGAGAGSGYVGYNSGTGHVAAESDGGGSGGGGGGATQRSGQLTTAAGATYPNFQPTGYGASVYGRQVGAGERIATAATSGTGGEALSGSARGERNGFSSSAAAAPGVNGGSSNNASAASAYKQQGTTYASYAVASGPYGTTGRSAAYGAVGPYGVSAYGRDGGAAGAPLSSGAPLGPLGNISLGSSIASKYLGAGPGTFSAPHPSAAGLYSASGAAEVPYGASTTGSAFSVGDANGAAVAYSGGVFPYGAASSQQINRAGSGGGGGGSGASYSMQYYGVGMSATVSSSPSFAPASGATGAYGGGAYSGYDRSAAYGANHVTNYSKAGGSGQGEWAAGSEFGGGGPTAAESAADEDGAQTSSGTGPNAGQGTSGVEA